MAYLFSNISTKNYWNWTITVKIIVGSWVYIFLGHSICLPLTENLHIICLMKYSAVQLAACFSCKFSCVYCHVGLVLVSNFFEDT